MKKKILWHVGVGAGDEGTPKLCLTHSVRLDRRHIASSCTCIAPWVASSFSLPQVFVKCLAYAALRTESRDSGDKQRHASPAVMSLGLGAQLVLAKRRH